MVNLDRKKGLSRVTEFMNGPLYPRGFHRVLREQAGTADRKASENSASYHELTLQRQHERDRHDEPERIHL